MSDEVVESRERSYFKCLVVEFRKILLIYIYFIDGRNKEIPPEAMRSDTHNTVFPSNHLFLITLLLPTSTLLCYTLLPKYMHSFLTLLFHADEPKQSIQF